MSRRPLPRSNPYDRWEEYKGRPGQDFVAWCEVVELDGYELRFAKVVRPSQGRKDREMIAHCRFRPTEVRRG